MKQLLSVINMSKLWIDPKLKSVFWTFWMLWCSCLQKKRSSKIWFNFEYYDFLCLLWMIFGFILSLIFGFILSLIFIAIYSIHWISDLNSDGSLYSLLTGWRWWGQSENRTSKNRKKRTSIVKTSRQFRLKLTSTILILFNNSNME